MLMTVDKCALLMIFFPGSFYLNCCHVKKMTHLPEWPHTRCEACRGRKITGTYLNPLKLVVLDFELQRRFAANYLFRKFIPGNDYTL